MKSASKFLDELLARRHAPAGVIISIVERLGEVAQLLVRYARRALPVSGRPGWLKLGRITFCRRAAAERAGPS